MRVAVVHYWWFTNRGGESVVKSILEMFPEADLFLHSGNHNLIVDSLGSEFKGNIRYTFINKIPFVKYFYKILFPLMPYALEALDLSGYELVISSEAGPAKGVITDPNSLHICYCHTPMRYFWDMKEQYISTLGFLSKFIFYFLSNKMRVWDVVSASRVDYFISNSNFIKKRIHKVYKRESSVIFPPVNVSDFSPTSIREDFYLLLGQLVNYKNPELAINAFNKNGLKLIVIGEGEMYDKLRSIAKGNIKFLGRQPSNIVKDHLERCKALVFPGLEDFGIVPVEANSAGAPVIAFGRGGVLDTIVDNMTGIYFHKLDVDSLNEAIEAIESRRIVFDSILINKHAMRFRKELFKSELQKFIEDKLKCNRVI
jgi:glycosyltransferase involved in cell wall biosynthesis